MTWNGAISATRAAVLRRDSIESTNAGQARNRYRNAVMRYRVSPFIVAAALAAPPAFAQMCKCAGERGGTPTYQDSPCPDGRELRNFATDPATVSVVPMR